MSGYALVRTVKVMPLNCGDENEFQLDDSDELGEFSVDEKSEGIVIIDIEEVNDDY